LAKGVAAVKTNTKDPIALSWEQARRRVKNVIDAPNGDIDRLIHSLLASGRVSGPLKEEFPLLARAQLAQGVEVAVRSAFGSIPQEAQSSDHERLDARSLALHRLIADKIRQDVSLLEVARGNIARWQVESGETGDPSSHTEWLVLIDGPVDELLSVLEGQDQRATRLRQSTPFTGILAPAERDAVFTAYTLANWRAARHD
jgi:hypothetical protein